MFDFTFEGFDLDLPADLDVDTSGYSLSGGEADAIYSQTPDNPYGYDAPAGDAGIGADGESPQPFVDSDPEGDLRDARMAQLLDIDIGTSSSGTQQQGDPNTFDKVMATLQKNPRMAAALIQGASGLIAGAGAGYAAKNKQEWEDKKIQEAWERRRLEAKPGTVRKENWGGLIQTAKA